MGSPPTRVHPTTKGPGCPARQAGGDTCQRTGPARQPAGGAGAQRPALRRRRRRAPGRPPRRSGSRGARAGTQDAAPHPRRARGGLPSARSAQGKEPEPSSRRSRAGARGREAPAEPRCGARRLALRRRAGRGARPDAPWLRGGPGRRWGRRRRCAYLLRCGGAAVALRGGDLRRRRQRSPRRGRFFQEGVGSACPPRRGPPPTYSGVPAARPPSERCSARASASPAPRGPA